MKQNSDFKFIPMPFSPNMIESILKGWKTNTRRLADVLESSKVARITCTGDKYSFHEMDINLNVKPLQEKCNVNDILWVREKFKYCQPFGCESLNYQYADLQIGASVDDEKHYKINNYDRFRPPMFMPKEACRIFLHVTDISCERLHDISADDAIAEGIVRHNINDKVRYSLFNHTEYSEACSTENPIESFRSLWKVIYKPNDWNRNPYVWSIKFQPYLSTFDNILDDIANKRNQIKPEQIIEVDADSVL